MTAESKKEGLQKKELVCLVAGGAGFIGSHLCETLLGQNFKVYCLDNLSTGSKDNIKDLLTHQNFHFIEADITQSLEALDTIESLDVIFHLAALEVSEKEKKFSLETLLVNSTGTRNLLEEAKKFKAKFVLVSSENIYQGSFSSNSLKYFFGAEESEAVMSQNEAKRFAEALTVEYFKNYHLKATIVRVQDVYGPKMRLDTGGELTRLINEAKLGERLVVHGDGLKTINPTFVSDVVFGLIKVVLGEFQGEIFNLISPEKTTEQGLAETLRLISGKLEIVHDEDQKLTFPTPALESDNTKEKLKWIPRVTLAEGLSTIFQSFRENEPAKMISLTPLPSEELRSGVGETPKKSKPIWNKGLRIAIFVISLLLILFTTAIPFVSFVLAARDSGAKTQEAFNSLEADQTDITVSRANQAVASAQKAEQNLNTVRWIFQLTGQREALKADEQIIFSANNTAAGLKLLSQVTGNLIKAENEPDPASAKDLLRQASQILAEAKQNFDLAKVSLGQIQETKLSPGLQSSLGIVKNVNEKAASAAENVSTSLDETLRKLGEPASTAP